MFVAVGVLSFCACGEKENGAGGDSEVADYPAAMNKTRWRWKGSPDASGINCVERFRYAGCRGQITKCLHYAEARKRLF